MMPAFQTWGPVGHHTGLPPTPPEYQTAYPTPTSAISDQGLYSSQGYQHHHGQTGRDFIDRYSHASAYLPQQALSVQPRLHSSQSLREYRAAPTYAPPGPPTYQYGPVAAPILPPIRAQDAMEVTLPQYGHAHPEVKVKEDKPTGGVALHLDYDMDVMADFVAEMSQGMYAIFSSGLCVADVDLMRSVAPGAQPTPQFRKYVSQILSSTRLPSSTIMLGMFYLASRMKIVSAHGIDVQPSSTVYRMLTTCLLLGSKFLDDNTFQNRSWAEVSSIPVQELNTMELQWLEGFGWTIHKPMYNAKEGFFTWIDHWEAYKDKADMAQAKDAHKLAPINTNLRHPQAYQQQPLLSPDGPIPPQYQQASHYDTHWSRPLISEYSPPSAPNSGPATPDYYGIGAWTYPQPPPPPYGGHHTWTQNASAAYPSQLSQPPSYHHTPTYGPPYSQSLWGPHPHNCGCSVCARHSDHYFAQQTYKMQSVAG